MSSVMRAATAVLVMAIVTTACAGSPEGEPSAPAAGSAVVEPSQSPAEEIPSGEIAVTAVDFDYDIPSTIAAGPTTFTFANAGTEFHEMPMVKLADGKGIDDVRGFLEESPNGKPPKWVVEEVGWTGAKPGKDAKRQLEADLTPGTYVVLCFVTSKANEGAPHFSLGMVKEITVV